MNLLTSLFYREVELCLYDFPHPGEIPPNEARIEAEHRILQGNSPDRGLISAVQGSRLTENRFLRGEKCFVALHEGRVVSYIWGARGIVGVEEIAMAVKPGPREVYLYDAFTLPPWRGRNLYPAVLQRALEDGRDSGLARSLIFVEARNTPSRRGVSKAGFSLFQTLFYTRVLFFGRPRLTEPLDGHPPAVFVPLP